MWYVINITTKGAVGKRSSIVCANRSKAVRLLWIIFVICVSCLSLLCCIVCSYITLFILFSFPIGVIYIPHLRSSVGRRSYPVDN